MKHDLPLILMMFIIPWLFLLYFGPAVYAAGMLLTAILLAAIASILNALIGREIAARNRNDKQ